MFLSQYLLLQNSRRCYEYVPLQKKNKKKTHLFNQALMNCDWIYVPWWKCILWGEGLPLLCNLSFTTVCSRDGGPRSKYCSSSPCTHMLRVKGGTSAPAGSCVAQSKVHTTEERPLPYPELSSNHRGGVESFVVVTRRRHRMKTAQVPASLGWRLGWHWHTSNLAWRTKIRNSLWTNLVCNEFEVLSSSFKIVCSVQQWDKSWANQFSASMGGLWACEWWGQETLMDSRTSPCVFFVLFIFSLSLWSAGGVLQKTLKNYPLRPPQKTSKIRKKIELEKFSLTFMTKNKNSKTKKAHEMQLLLSSRPKLQCHMKPQWLLSRRPRLQDSTI